MTEGNNAEIRTDVDCAGSGCVCQHIDLDLQSAATTTVRHGDDAYVPRRVAREWQWRGWLAQFPGPVLSILDQRWWDWWHRRLNDRRDWRGLPSEQCLAVPWQLCAGAG